LISPPPFRWLNTRSQGAVQAADDLSDRGVGALGTEAPALLSPTLVSRWAARAALDWHRLAVPHRRRPF
jgi:hypothetical protein